MQRAAEKCDMPADRFAAGQTADRLIDHCLENGSGQVFFGRAFIDKRLDVGFGKYAASGRDRIKRVVVFGIFV